MLISTHKSLALHCHVMHVDPQSLVNDGLIDIDDCRLVWREIELLYAEKRSFSNRHAAAEHISVGRRPSLEEPKASRYKENIQLSLDL